jgi:hypothetical protein
MNIVWLLKLLSDSCACTVVYFAGHPWPHELVILPVPLLYSAYMLTDVKINEIHVAVTYRSDTK